ncbi:hypothetical protein BCR33DRAFT_727647 [Rhizoclosmatium globosum]|uniref:Uncharacterized protein n=1 Tax=Rhizoclosmatium globosum TaxID=329046 RepID=A0A1Y2ANP9_9FUNG|nr:hypothetical protein BCR33DRAFT_727642 [Rhizoclosmatium globosum]ORY24184.1 hypothetical protein BCR33DRAFT_727647 [Rhizoclosmatium globosum]|eukprot:ORY24181.1 hypothetical protein BCR33DRAFT_727642 [Rhizoclosmatium globosum]
MQEADRAPRFDVDDFTFSSGGSSYTVFPDNHLILHISTQIQIHTPLKYEDASVSAVKARRFRNEMQAELQTLVEQF